MRKHVWSIRKRWLLKHTFAVIKLDGSDRDAAQEGVTPAPTTKPCATEGPVSQILLNGPATVLARSRCRNERAALPNGPKHTCEKHNKG